MQVLKSFTAQKLSAHLVARRRLAFDQRNASPSAGECDGSGATGHSTATDENFILHRNPIQSGSYDWNLLFGFGTQIIPSNVKCMINAARAY
jgi:hypothetical protein